MRYAMIMAGGAGTRLWPMSRRDRPKQLLRMIDGRSLIELALERLDGVIPPPQQFICTAERHRAALRTLLPDFRDEQILGEPVGRDTLNAIGLTAAVLQQRGAEAIFAVLTADHIINPVATFQDCLKRGFALVEDDNRRFVTFAITPDHPATEFGYLHLGAPITGCDGAHEVRRFVEKPAPDVAKSYVEQGGYGWNSGMFVFQAARILNAIEQFRPEAHAGLRTIAEAWDTPRRDEVLRSIYPELPSVSIDFGVMEPASLDPNFHVCAVTMPVQWCDVGSWPSYGQTLEADAHGNRTNAHLIPLNSRNVLAVSDDPDHVIAMIGCENLIIIRTADATLICPADQAQQVKALTELVHESLR